MSEHVIENNSDDCYVRIFFSGDVTLRDIALAYREVLSRADLSCLHRFLWDFRRARLDALTDEDLLLLAQRTNGGRHPHNGGVIADAIVVGRPQDFDRMNRWRAITGDVAGVADRIFTDHQKAVHWLVHHVETPSDDARPERKTPARGI